MKMDDTHLTPESSADPKTEALFWKTTSGNGIEVSYDPVHWPKHSLAQFAQMSVNLLDHIDAEFGLDRIVIGLLLCSDDRIRELNRRFRGNNRPTNVLSFSQLGDDFVGDDSLNTTNLPHQHFFGEIAIARETVMAQADQLGIEVDDHLAHLFVHGVMHLLGYDHEHEKEATEMEALEVAILAAFSIASPYMIAESVVDDGMVS